MWISTNTFLIYCIFSIFRVFSERLSEFNGHVIKIEQCQLKIRSGFILCDNDNVTDVRTQNM